MLSWKMRDRAPLPTRRTFLQRLGAFAILIALRPVSAFAATKPFKHPDPRPGVTSAKVIPDDKLPPKNRNVRFAYAAARAHPEIFDGLACACGCADEHRSLLTCYETEQPTGCYGCRELAVLVGEEIAKGKNLTEIRQVYDKKHG
jgi:hypothetical protein